MPTDNSFSRRTTTERPLPVFLHQGHELFVAEPGRLLGPLIACIDAIHRSGQSHGAVTPCCVMVSTGGVINLDFLRTRAGAADPTEALTYYPAGPGDSLESRQRRDAQALGAVLHLIVAGYPPASPERRLQKLAETPSAKEWPTAFIDAVDGLLAVGEEAVLPTLREVAATVCQEKAPVPEMTVPANPEIAEPVEVARSLPSVRLPNGMVGRSLSASVADAFTGETPGLIEIMGDAPAGLDFSDGLLSGTPELVGEFDITFRLNDVECTVSLTINPDPRSLWKNAPSDQAGEFWKPDEDIAFLAEAPITVLGASLRGRSHAHVGGFRDDDMAMEWFPANSWYALTVADGAGSAKYSRQGSKIACETVKAWFAQYFAETDNTLTHLLNTRAADAEVMGELYNLFGNAAVEARKAIDAQATASHATPRDFHTTLVTALLHPLMDGSWFIATFSIGDGAAAVVSVPAANPCLLTRPDGGEYAGQTVFLTMNESLVTYEAVMGRIKTAIIPGFEALLLVTDGISDPRFPSEAALADPAAWSLLWSDLKTAVNAARSPEEASTAILRWMEFHSPGHHDDRTLILATPLPIIPKP